MWQLVFASRHRLIPQQEEEEEQEDAKRVSDGHGRSFRSGPWQKDQSVFTRGVKLAEGRATEFSFTKTILPSQ